METLLLVGVVAFVLLLLGGGEAQANPKLPKVIYLVAEPGKSDAGPDGTGCLLFFAVAIIALLAFSLPT
jgi:hypothetical protein